MTRIPITFDIIETDQQLEKLFLLEIVKELNIRIPNILPSMSNKMRVATFTFLQTTDTYHSLVSGELSAHFGLPGAGRKARIDAIILAVANGMEVTFKPIKLRSKQFVNGLRFRVLMNNLSEVLNLLEGEVVTEKGQVLQWLNWLLLFGDKMIVDEYDILLQSGKGRSGGGIMVADNAGSWRVPPTYSGTIKKNWLTRAFKDNSAAYLSIIEEIINNEMKRM